VEVSGGYTDWVWIDVGGFGAPQSGGACGIRATGQAYCWGVNPYGQVGDGTTTQRLTPTEISGGHTDWEAIAPGNQFACGIGCLGTMEQKTGLRGLVG